MPISLFLSVKGVFGIGGGAHFYFLMFPLGIALCYIFKNYKKLLEKYLTPILTISIFIFLFIYNNSFNTTLSYVETVLMLISIVLILTLGISLLNENNNYSIIMIYGNCYSVILLKFKSMSMKILKKKWLFWLLIYTQALICYLFLV